MSSAEDVVAVLAGTPAQLADQTVPLTATFVGRDALQRAVSSDADWIWFLAPGAHPRRDALERLLDAVRPDGEPPALVVAGMVVDSASRPIEDHLPAAAHRDASGIVRLVSQRLLPIRHATFANCLVERAAFARYGLPDASSFGRHAPVAWTASALSGSSGYFTPLSVAVLPPGTEPNERGSLLADISAAARTALSGAWTRGECVRAFLRIVSSGRGAVATGRSPSSSLPMPGHSEVAP